MYYNVCEVILMVVRISTHNGSKAHREHNIRKDYVVSSQDHIDTSRSSLNEIWADEKHSQAYKRIFGQALEEYNNRQKRADRKIKDYYRHICKDKKKHPVYEMIVQVGGMNDNIPLETHKAILREFYNAFCEKNSSFECIGAYLHLDEATPHLHLDYIPVATGYKNGMSKQNGLVKALGQMGYTKEGKQTAQIQWEHAMNETLEKICNKYGIEVEHPRLGLKHLDTKTYKDFEWGIYFARQDVHKRINQALANCSEATRKEFRQEFQKIGYGNYMSTDELIDKSTDKDLRIEVANRNKRRK